MNHFTTNNGLPSNHIYGITQDNFGFLWIATDNGVSRFDGKYFQNFSIKDGLPSNDVIQIKKSSDGTIWVNCYQQVPAYFNELTNKFEATSKDSNFKLMFKNFSLISNWDGDTIDYKNDFGRMRFYNRKLVETFKGYNKHAYIRIGNDYLNFKLIGYECIPKKVQLHLSFSNKIFDSLPAQLGPIFSSFYKNALYIQTNSNYIYKYRFLKLQPFSAQKDSLQLRNLPININLCNDHLNVVYKNNTLENFDITKFQSQVVIYQAGAICAYSDQLNNIWIGTLNNGFYYYAFSKIKIVELPKEVKSKRFISIANNKNLIACGNDAGQIFGINKQSTFVKTNSEDRNELDTRKIVFCGESIFCMNDNKYSIDFQKPMPVINSIKFPDILKNAFCLNDSIIIISTINGAQKLNINTKSIQALNIEPYRISQLAKQNDSEFYFINAKGLCNYDMLSNTYKYIDINTKDAIAKIFDGGNNWLWGITAAGNLNLIYKNKIVVIIKNEIGLPENITNLVAHKNKLWIASRTGLYRLTHNQSIKNFLFQLQMISIKDGLPSDIINDITCKDNHVYCATESGIAYLQESFEHTHSVINPQLIQLKVNQVLYKISNNLQLSAKQNNLQFTFSGIDISGHFKDFQYALNDTTEWTNLEGNTLNIQLSSGKHILYIRARDNNYLISSKKLSIAINIATPFYKSIWLWLLFGIVVSALGIRWYSQRKLSKLKIIFDQQLALEQQRSKITADLHDDIGATLSSLQVNSMVANQLITKNPIEAQKVIQKVEDQSKDLADKIGDIIWSLKPEKEAFITIGTRIKNFANDILGATDMHYQIEIAPSINDIILDITTRKNIVLITKEAINNIVKYSKATNIKVTLFIQHQQIILHIADNGIGFDSNIINGNGITNMHKRALESNANFLIRSVPNMGTTIEVKFNIVP